MIVAMLCVKALRLVSFLYQVIVATVVILSTVYFCPSKRENVHLKWFGLKIFILLPVLLPVVILSCTVAVSDVGQVFEYNLFNTHCVSVECVKQANFLSTGG